MPSKNPISAIPSSAAAPAGWYHDPLGLPQLRWWNGMMWTTQSADPRPEIQVSTAFSVHMVSAP